MNLESTREGEEYNIQYSLVEYIMAISIIIAVSMTPEILLVLILLVTKNNQHHYYHPPPRFQSEAGAPPNLDLDKILKEDYDYPLAPNDGATLLASTLDGHLVAINQANGEVLWELNDEPVVRSPYDSTKPSLPAFLPDPKDGSIYMIGRGLKEPLKKLPFTIPELVAASPCKSSDGILYTGKKVDTWFSVDRFTGSKQGSLTFNGCIEGQDDKCPNLGPSNFLGMYASHLWPLHGCIRFMLFSSPHVNFDIFQLEEQNITS